MGVANLRESLFTKDSIGIEVIFEFKKIMRGVFQEKRQMFEGSIRIPSTGFTEKCESVRPGPVPKATPFLFRPTDQSEVPRVDTFLLWPEVLGHMGHNLMAVEI
jgi:hypothetical protein